MRTTHRAPAPSAGRALSRRRARAPAAQRRPAPPPAVAAPAAPSTAASSGGGRGGAVAPPPAVADLPPSLAKSVAVLRRGGDGGVPVYVLGVSHVSAVSVEQTAALIARVAPDAVLVELCNDRLGLLLPPRDKGTGPAPQVWHAAAVRLAGVPADGGWPPAAALLACCRAAPGVPVTTSDIEADCVALQATGLFRSVRPSTTLPPDTAAPAYVKGAAQDAATAAAAAAPIPPLTPAMPLGDVRFTAVPRELPPPTSVSWRLDSALAAAGGSVDAAAADAAAADLLAATDAAAAAGRRGGVAGALAGAAPGLAGMVKGVDAGAASVSYGGIETGRVEIVFKLADAARAGLPLTGLEASAVGGVGAGIEPFVPYRGPLPLTKTMRVDNAADVLPVERATIDDVAPAEDGGGGGAGAATSFVGRWPPPAEAKKEEEEGEEGNKADADAAADAADADASDDDDDDSPLTTALDWLARTLTKRYARYQSAAGDKAGVPDGAAWRAALAAAHASAPTAAVLVADAPSSKVGRKLAARVAAAVPVALAVAVGVAAAAQHAIDGGLVQGDAATALRVAAVAAISATVWPFVGPLVEVSRFAAKSGDELEALVAPAEPLQTTNAARYWGEDALLGWPGAVGPLIHDRDAYMAAVAHAAAGGEALVPGYARDAADAAAAAADGGAPARRRDVWRYATPARGPIAGAAPCRVGEGQFELPASPRAVVAVVGTAHVPGMRRAWARLEAGEVSARELAEGVM